MCFSPLCRRKRPLARQKPVKAIPLEEQSYSKLHGCSRLWSTLKLKICGARQCESALTVLHVLGGTFLVVKNVSNYYKVSKLRQLLTWTSRGALFHMNEIRSPFLSSDSTKRRRGPNHVLVEYATCRLCFVA